MRLLVPKHVLPPRWDQPPGRGHRELLVASMCSRRLRTPHRQVAFVSFLREVVGRCKNASEVVGGRLFQSMRRCRVCCNLDLSLGSRWHEGRDLGTRADWPHAYFLRCILNWPHQLEAHLTEMWLHRERASHSFEELRIIIAQDTRTINAHVLLTPCDTPKRVSARLIEAERPFLECLEMLARADPVSIIDQGQCFRISPALSFLASIHPV